MASLPNEKAAQPECLSSGRHWLGAAIRYLAASVLLLLSPVLPATATSPVYPLEISASGRYLVDQNNTPFLLVGDSPHALLANISGADAAYYLADRATNGFNTLWVETLCNTYVEGRADGSLLDGTLPFTNTIPGTSSYDLTTPNEAYFAYLDQIINLAATNGIQVMLDPIETGGWLTTMLDNGTINCRAYGQYLGNRYKNCPNLIWISGNDFQTWTDPDDDAVVTAVALGIKDNDTNHLQTVELSYLSSSSLDDPNWAPIVGMNGAYTYYPTYDEVLHAYNQSTNLPVFLEEANYEFENLQGPVTTAPILRKQEYWTLLSGGAGQLYGNAYIWPFLSGWQAYLDTLGTVELGYVTALFAPRAWYNLVPDTNHTVVTAGYGTYSSSGYVADDDYLTAASTPDGTLAIAYMPTLRTITVNLASFSAAVTARWYDPSSGFYYPITGSPFTNTDTQDFMPPRNNSDGDGGWVLVLETAPLWEPPPPVIPVLPALVQANSATPQTPQTQVAVDYPNIQVQGDVNILAIGWNDTTANIVAVNDSAGNVYQAAVPVYQGDGLSQAIYYATNIVLGSNTVMVTFDQPATYVDLRATEYSGLSPTNTFDVGASDSGNGVFADSGQITTSTANELLFGAGMAASGFTDAGAGFSQRIYTPDEDIIEDEVALATGSYSATALLRSDAWLMQVAAFQAADPPLVVVQPQIITATFSNSDFVVSFTTVSGQDYELQGSVDLTSSSWSPLVTNILGTGDIMQITDTNALGQSQRFYRVKSEMSP